MPRDIGGKSPSCPPAVSRKSSDESKKSYEVFRNTTTAIEVVVKEVPRCKKSRSDASMHRCERDSASDEPSRVILAELQGQLHLARQKEIEYQMRIVHLQIENEKLKVLSNSKASVIQKLKQEIALMKNLTVSISDSIAKYIKSAGKEEYSDLHRHLSSVNDMGSFDKCDTMNSSVNSFTSRDKTI